MDAILPWQALCKLILPHYPAGERGRPPVGVERMLRIYLMQPEHGGRIDAEEPMKL